MAALMGGHSLFSLFMSPQFPKGKKADTANKGGERLNRSAGYALHVMTASGAAAGLLALQAVIDGNVRSALLWLLLCQVLD
jgi:hypothetical protein